MKIVLMKVTRSAHEAYLRKDGRMTTSVGYVGEFAKYRLDLVLEDGKLCVVGWALTPYGHYQQVGTYSHCDSVYPESAQLKLLGGEVVKLAFTILDDLPITPRENLGVTSENVALALVTTPAMSRVVEPSYPTACLWSFVGALHTLWPRLPAIVQLEWEDLARRYINNNPNHPSTHVWRSWLTWVRETQGAK